MLINKQRIRMVALVAVALAAALAIGMRVSFLVTDRVAPGVRVAGVSVGGLTKPEATERLRTWARGHLNSGFTLVVADHNWTGSLMDIGVTVNARSMANAAYSVGRRGNIVTRLADIAGAPVRGRKVSVPYKFDRSKIEGLIAKIKATSTSPAKDARISFVDGTRSIVPEAPGTTIKVEGSMELIRSAVERGETSAALPIIIDQPKVTAFDLDQVDTLLASYTTRFPAWRKARTHNLRLAASAIDGTLIRPGEVFSYNKEVGPRVKETGFRDALIYVKGKMIPGTGGGICQVSSTVYNAALLSNMEIVERSNHSMPVPYVPLGRDATVAYGLLDLKFKNTTSAPVYLAAKAGRGSLTVQMYGAAKDKRDVRVVTTSPKRIERANGKISTFVTVYRVVSEAGGKALRQRISRDRYDPAPPHTPAPQPRPVRIASRD